MPIFSTLDFRPIFSPSLSLSRRLPKAKPDSPWLHANNITFTLLLQK